MSEPYWLSYRVKVHLATRYNATRSHCAHHHWSLELRLKCVWVDFRWIDLLYIGDGDALQLR